MNLNDFRNLIHEDDLKAYLTTIGELSLSKQRYTIRYRILKMVVIYGLKKEVKESLMIATQQLLWNIKSY